MATKKSGLGKGYESLFYDNATELSEDSGSVMLPIGEVEPDRSQPRTDFDEEAMAELINSVREYGILQPLLVRPVSNGTYKIVAGERRYRAARAAGLSQVPVIIRAFTEQEAAAIALIENLQREDLNPVEEALGIQRLMQEFGFTQEQAAEKLSKSRPAITNVLRLLNLPQETLEKLRKNLISAGHARALLGLNNKYVIDDVANRVIEEQLSVRQTENLVKILNTPERAPRSKKSRDKYYDETELALSHALGRSVSVINKGKGGRLEIEFFDMDDLKKLSQLFNED